MAQLNKPDKILDTPIAVKIRIRRRKVSGYRKKDLYPWKRPDIDNYMKPVFDAMQGVIYTDDSRICRLIVVKVFNERPGMDIEIEEIEETEDL